MHFRMLDGLENNLSLLDEGNLTFLEEFEVFTFRDAVNVAAYIVMSAGEEKNKSTLTYMDILRTVCVCVCFLILLSLKPKTSDNFLSLNYSFLVFLSWNHPEQLGVSDKSFFSITIIFQ